MSALYEGTAGTTTLEVTVDNPHAEWDEVAIAMHNDDRTVALMMPLAEAAKLMGALRKACDILQARERERRSPDPR